MGAEGFCEESLLLIFSISPAVVAKSQQELAVFIVLYHSDLQRWKENHIHVVPVFN